MWTVWGLLALRLIQKSRDNLLWGETAARLTEFILGELSEQNKYLIRGLTWTLEGFTSERKARLRCYCATSPLSSYNFSVCRLDFFFFFNLDRHETSNNFRLPWRPSRSRKYFMFFFFVCFFRGSPCNQSADPVSISEKTTKYAPLAQMCTCSAHFIKYALAGTCVDFIARSPWMNGGMVSMEAEGTWSTLNSL